MFGGVEFAIWLKLKTIRVCVFFLLNERGRGVVLGKGDVHVETVCRYSSFILF